MSRRITGLFACFALAGAIAAGGKSRADDAKDGRRVHNSVLRLRDEVFNNCIVKFQLKGALERIGSPVSTETGQLTYARIGSAIFTDRAIIAHLPERAGQRASDIPLYNQYFLANGRRCIGTTYKVSGSKRQIRIVHCDPTRTFDISLRAMCNSIFLDTLLVEFRPTGESLVEITKNEPSQIHRRPNGGLTAIYSTPYGNVEIEMEIVNGKDSIAGAKIEQGRNDVSSSYAKSEKLSDVRQSILEVTPNGLTSAKDGFRINYGSPGNGKPFASITTSTGVYAEGKDWRMERTLSLVEYRTSDDANEIEKLRIPIPEGEPVQSIDPEYKSLALAYRGGEVVRQVDGKSLDEVIASDRRRNRMAKLAASLVSLIVISTVISLWIRRWTIRRVVKVGPP